MNANQPRPILVYRRALSFFLAGLILAITSLSCGLPDTIRDFTFSEDDPERVQVTSIPELSIITFEELWEVEWVRLVKEQVHCNSSIKNYYMPCLQKTMLGGASAEAALQSCGAHLRGIKKNDSPGEDGQVVIYDNAYFYRDKDNKFLLVYQSNQQSIASGEVLVEFLDTSLGSCRVKFSYVFSGAYLPETCKMSGSGTYQAEYEGSKCFGENQNYEATWEATLLDGHLNGFVQNTGISFDFIVR